MNPLGDALKSFKSKFFKDFKNIYEFNKLFSKCIYLGVFKASIRCAESKVKSKFKVYSNYY